jgi:hypothetical protein
VQAQGGSVRTFPLPDPELGGGHDEPVTKEEESPGQRQTFLQALAEDANEQQA